MTRALCLRTAVRFMCLYVALLSIGRAENDDVLVIENVILQAGDDGAIVLCDLVKPNHAKHKRSPEGDCKRLMIVLVSETTDIKVCSIPSEVGVWSFVPRKIGNSVYIVSSSMQEPLYQFSIVKDASMEYAKITRKDFEDVLQFDALRKAIRGSRNTNVHESPLKRFFSIYPKGKAVELTTPGYACELVNGEHGWVGLKIRRVKEPSPSEPVKENVRSVSVDEMLKLSKSE